MAWYHQFVHSQFDRQSECALPSHYHLHSSRWSLITFKIRIASADRIPRYPFLSATARAGALRSDRLHMTNYTKMIVYVIAARGETQIMMMMMMTTMMVMVMVMMMTMMMTSIPSESDILFEIYDHLSHVLEATKPSS